MWNVEGQCCFQNTGPKTRDSRSSDFSSISAASVQTGQNVLDDSQEAEEELNDNQSRPKKEKKYGTGKMSMVRPLLAMRRTKKYWWHLAEFCM